MAKIPLIIDTDVALGAWHEGRPRDIDDGFAIVEALNSEHIDLLGITTVYGNAPHPDVLRIAGELVSLKEADTPVHPGAETNQPGNAILPAVQFLADTLKTQKVNIAAIGPLTNIAQLVEKFPEVLGNINQLIIVAGRTPGNRFFIGDTGPVRDFNFENDVAAMATLLAAKLPLVLAGFELTSVVEVSEADLSAIKARNNPTADYFYTNSLDWVRHWTESFPTDKGFHPWDSAAISYLLHPEYFAAEQRFARIDQLDDKPALSCSSSQNAATDTPVTYLSGFVGDGKTNFVRDVVSTVY